MRKKESADKANAGSDDQPEKLQKTMFFFPRTLNQNLDVLSMMRGRSKGDLVREAVAQFVKDEGLDPLRSPTINVSVRYGDDSPV